MKNIDEILSDYFGKILEQEKLLRETKAMFRPMSDDERAERIESLEEMISGQRALLDNEDFSGVEKFVHELAAENSLVVEEDSPEYKALRSGLAKIQLLSLEIMLAHAREDEEEAARLEGMYIS